MNLILILLSVAAAVSITHSIKVKSEKAEKSSVYKDQLKTLDGIDSSIEDLREFVSGQKAQLLQQEIILEQLRTEEAKLRPLVEAKREVLSAVLEFQAEKDRAYVWKDRSIGFALGVLASLTATTIFGFFSSLRF